MPTAKYMCSSYPFTHCPTLQSMGRTAQTHYSLCFVVQVPGNFPGLVIFVRLTVLELGASHFPNFRIIACFSIQNS